MGISDNMANDGKIIHGVKNASYLTIGKLISQGIGLVGFYYIAKILGPTQYGIYSTVVAFVAFFQIFIFTGLSKVVIRKGCEQLNTFSEVLENTFAIRLSFVIIAIVLCIASVLFTGYSTQTKLYIVIFSCGIFDTGFKSFFNTIYQAHERMEYIAVLNVIFRISFTICSIIALFYGHSILAILLLNLIARFSVLFANYRASQKFVRFRLNLNLNWDLDIVKPALIFSLIAFINTLAIKIDILMISFLSTPQDVGIYALAHKIANEGNMLRNIIGMAFFPIGIKYFATKNQNAGRLLGYICMLFVATSAICTLLSFPVPKVVVFLFGHKYSQSGDILRYLMFYLVFSFATIPSTVSLQATKNEKLALIASGAMVMLNIPLNIIFFRSFGLIGIAYSTLVVQISGFALLSTVTYFALVRQGYVIGWSGIGKDVTGVEV